MAYVPNSGSVAAWLQSDNASVITTIPALQGASVSGMVGASIIGLPPVNVVNTVNVSGSVVGFLQGNASIITVSQSSVAVAIVSGSIVANFTPPANQSVSGVVSISNFPANQSISGSIGITGTPAVSVQGTIFVSGSVITVGGSGVANQSVSGTVGSSILGNVNTTITSVATIGGFLNVNLVGGSILTSATANQSVSGAVSISNLPANQSVSGTVGASIIGLTPVVVTNTPSISGTVLIGANVTINSPSVYGNISGSIAGTYIEPTVVTSVTGIALIFKSNISSSTMTAVGVGAPLPVSVQGTIGASIIGVVPVTGFPTTQNVSGSVVAFQGTSPFVVNFQNSSIIAISTGSVVAVPTGNQSISGTVNTLPTGTIMTSIVSTIPSSVIVGASIFGQLPAGTAPIGSVATLQGTNPWIVVGSVYGNISGSVVSFQAGLNTTSIVGTPSISGGVVNFWGSPTASWISGSTSLLTGVYQPVAGSVSGQFTYITAIQAANASANNVYLTFSGAGLGSTVGSIIGYTVVPANGGSNIVYTNALKTGSGAPFQASMSGVASVFISAQGFTSGN